MADLVWPNGGIATPIFYKDIPNGFRWTSPFGMRTHPVTGRPSTMHYGLDLIGLYEIKAPSDGVITFSGYNGGAGNEVRMRSDGPNAFIKGDVYRLLHNSKLLVKAGQRVVAGQTVAIIGTTGSSTGIHCHFETRPGGGNAVNPMDYMRQHITGKPSGGGGTPIVPPKKRKKESMTTGVIYTNDAADKNRTGAIVDLAHGVFDPFGWFPVSYADNLGKAFGNEKAAPVTRAHFDSIKKAAAAKAAALGKVFVDIDDADIPKLQLEE